MGLKELSVYRKTIWSPVEVEYLKKHRHDAVNQLTIALAKSQHAVRKRIKQGFDGKVLSTKKPNQRYSKIGKRKDCNNMFFRSGWEANVYRLLRTDKDIKLIEYEPTTFSFTSFGILKGTVSYTPDFKITYQDGSYEWIEVKGGWMKAADKTKLRRFKKFFPDEYDKLVAVTPGPTSKTTKFFEDFDVPIKWHYPELNKTYRKTIPNWE